MSAVGIVVNPLAGKDIRRLVSAAGHTSDAAKIGIVRRVVAAAAEAGASRILLAPDPHRLAERAADGLGAPVEVLDEEVTGSRHDTVAAAARFWKEQVSAVVALGGDGTCRDVATGWPDAPLVAISTGTNNVFPSAVDGTSAGTAAGLLAAGAVRLGEVARRAKRVSVRCHDDGYGRSFDDLALVEVAIVDTTFVGARAVSDPRSITAVVAAIATPASTGLSSIAGRLAPCGRWEPGGVLVRLDRGNRSGPGARRVRVPLAPGSFATVAVSEVVALADDALVTLEGPGVLALDGERDRRLGAGAAVEATVETAGPWLVDVDATLSLAATRHCFDAPAEDPHGH